MSNARREKYLNSDSRLIDSLIDVLLYIYIFVRTLEFFQTKQ